MEDHLLEGTDTFTLTIQELDHKILETVIQTVANMYDLANLAFIFSALQNQHTSDNTTHFQKILK